MLDEAAKRQVPVHRVSQGSGIMLMTDYEIVEMLAMGRKARFEVNLFIGPRATFDIGAQVFSTAGKTLGLEFPRRRSARLAHGRRPARGKTGSAQRAGFGYRHSGADWKDEGGGRITRRT